MAQLSEAIARYHELLQSGYRDLDWAEGLQEQMRRRNLTDSGRPVSPVLRPHFITRRQLENLTRVAERLTAILDRVGLFCIESPSLLQRLRMLPAERMLATLPSGYSRLAVAARLEAHLHNGSLTLHGFDGCRSAGLAHADLLADLFLNLPIVKQFKRGNYKLSKLGGIRHLHAAILHAWKEFGGSHAPNIGIIEAGQQSLSANGEAAILAELFSRLGSPARPISLEELEYRGGHLSTRGFRIDIAFRRVLTRELLLRSDFSQPLLEAYQNHAVCLVNSFRSEVALRRGLFDPLTDETVIERFPAADRKLIRSFVPWTRIVSARKTNYRDEPINLLEFILRERERLILLPGDEGSEQRVFAGSDMSEQAWERALHHALNVPYVVQERDTAVCELFPVFAYGELCMRTLEVTVHPHVLNGEVQGAVAALKPGNGAGVAQLGIAPVLVLEQH